MFKKIIEVQLIKYNSRFENKAGIFEFDNLSKITWNIKEYLH